MNRQMIRTAVLVSCAALLAAGCGSGNGAGEERPNGQGTGETPASVGTEPVTLSVAVDGIIIDDNFSTLLQRNLKEKYPNITLDIIQPGKGTTLDDLIVSGKVPDLVFTYNGKLASYKDKGLLYDMSPQLKSLGIDTGRFSPQYVRDAQIASEHGEWYGMPFRIDFHALYYNKDLFDKFGVTYPSDGMTWDNVLEMTKRLSRKDGGTSYRGFDPGSTVLWMAQPLSVASVDPKTDRASVANDSWKRVFELAKAIYTIPGNEYSKAGVKTEFMKTKTLAMLLNLNILADLEKASQDGLNWDVAQYPSYPDKPNTYGNASVNVIMITTASKHKEEAAAVVKTVVSDEVQLAMSRQGQLSPLQNGQVLTSFGADKPLLAGKHLQSIFKSHPVPYPVASVYRGKGDSIVAKKFLDYMNGTIDVQTALSQAEEEINKTVATEKGK